MKALYTIIALLCAISLQAQKFTKADIAGTYHIYKMYGNDTLLVDLSSERANTTMFLSKMDDIKKHAPAGFEVDTAYVVKSANDTWSYNQFMDFDFEEGGTFTIRIPDMPNDTVGTWRFDEAAQHIVYNEKGAPEQIIVPQRVNGKVYFIIKPFGINANRMEMIKE